MNKYKKRFTDNQVISIRESQKSNKQLAKKYNVSQSCISNLRTGRTYSNIKGSNNPWQRSPTPRKITRKQKELIIKYLKKGTITNRGIAKFFKLHESYIHEIAAKLGIIKKSKGNTKYNKITIAYILAVHTYLDNYRLTAEKVGISIGYAHRIINKQRGHYG
jgi:transposase